MNSLKRPARTTRPKRRDKGEPGKRATRTFTNATSCHNLAFFDRAHLPERALARTTHPNELTRTPSNDPAERVDTNTLKRPDPTLPACFHEHPHMTRPNPPERNFGFPWAHGPNKILGFPWAHPQMTCPNDLTETKGKGRAGKTSCTNVHKSNLG